MECGFEAQIGPKAAQDQIFKNLHENQIFTKFPGRRYQPEAFKPRGGRDTNLPICSCRNVAILVQSTYTDGRGRVDRERTRWWCEGVLRGRRRDKDHSRRLRKQNPRIKKSIEDMKVIKTSRICQNRILGWLGADLRLKFGFCVKALHVNTMSSIRFIIFRKSDVLENRFTFSRLSGISTSQSSKIERGIQNTTWDLILRLLGLMECSLVPGAGHY